MMHPDGTVDLHCRVCGEDLGRVMYQGFSTVECIKCQQAAALEKEKPKEKTNG